MTLKQNQQNNLVMISCLYFNCSPRANNYGPETIVEYKTGLIKKESIM